jgi:superfamily II DNA or RNA helicase
MQEGIDVPSIASVFNAPAGKSAIGVLQKLGRGGRVTKTKNTMEFWDIYDVGHQNLRRQANARRDAMASETECPVETIEDSRQLALISGR